ncbi:MAG: endonuclease III [Elusimicrobiota bacterium]
MNKSNRIYDMLCNEYPRAKTALRFRTPWQMLVATILSAQCTDKRVNEVTALLFEKHPSIADYLDMPQDKLISFIKPAGFFNNKSKNILAAAKKISSEFKGKVPRTIDDLISIPGVARKTANVVLGNAYGITEGIAVDTHVKRLSYRIGLSRQKVPEKIEQDLMKIYPKEKWINLTYILIEHGRAVCKAPTPICSKCSLAALCDKNSIIKST